MRDLKKPYTFLYQRWNAAQMSAAAEFTKNVYDGHSTPAGPSTVQKNMACIYGTRNEWCMYSFVEGGRVPDLGTGRYLQICIYIALSP